MMKNIKMIAFTALIVSAIAPASAQNTSSPGTSSAALPEQNPDVLRAFQVCERNRRRGDVKNQWPEEYSNCPAVMEKYKTTQDAREKILREKQRHDEIDLVKSIRK